MDLWYDHFLELLSIKYPKKARLAQVLMDLLHLEREAIYRRLRKDVPFTSHEIVKIASTWSISLDEIVGGTDGKVSFLMQPMNYLNPSKEEFSGFQKKIQTAKSLGQSPDSEHMSICNNLPRSLSANYPYLYRFEIFKWAYQYNEKKTNTQFSQIVLPEKVRREITDFCKHVKQMGNTAYIFDYMIFDYLVRNILYFHSILLITDEEKELIKNDLYTLLDYMSEMASKGYYPETKKKVSIYISKINIDTNYSYYYAEKFKICRIHVFGKYDISTYDPDMIARFKTWMQLKRRTAVQISEVDTKGRIEFFTKQRQLIDGL
jgi:hypothetical protein